ncbi:MAG: phytoene desaturase [Ignavibacteria bacterium]|nr:MAG: phytoene desaturase [Ignavibacteria bacterium]KAF0155681.1 MAG: phytoene desaturase [Ignavibacteria bacterium]
MLFSFKKQRVVMKKSLIIGSGLGGLATALRLVNKGYKVTILEKHSTPGGRMNVIEMDGFRFDMGPSFMSMTYEFDELFNSVGIKNPVEFEELEPLYQVFFEGKEKPRRIFKDLLKLQDEFADVEPNLAIKVDKYLKRAGEFWHDTEDKVVKSNFDSVLSYLLSLSSVPWKHIPYLYRTMWSEVEKKFESEEVRIVFSLVAFFLGATPFQTPAIYSLLNYTEMRHNGYWRIKCGMYRLIEELVKILKSKGVEFYFNTEVKSVGYSNDKLTEVVDLSGKKWKADIFISNADAASFRGEILGRKKFSEEKLDKMHWTLAPFTIYLGVKGKIKNIEHHNYFLGSNFRGYADTIFTSSISPKKPYYYVNVLSKSDITCAPEGCENLFILCPAPDLRFKKDWSDKDELANNIINNLSARTGFDIQANTLVKKILTPNDWADTLNLYKGSGLGLAHDINQVGAFRPKNKDEYYNNLYYVGASTIPGTGLPMVVISSRLVTERIFNDHSIS